MQKILVLVLGLLTLSTGSPIHQNSDAYSDPDCPGNIKNLWLDVVIVVDRSSLMTDAQLWQVRNTITTVFGEVKNIGPVKYPADPRSTCVGMVTYDSNATITAQLDAAHSFSELYNIAQGSLVAVDSGNTSFLSTGLLAAQKVLKEGRNRTYRYNYKQVIIAFAAAYQGFGTMNDALPVAEQLINNDVTIITVSCTKDPYQSGAIHSLASDGMAFDDDMNTSKLARQLTNALITANCYCPEDWNQLTDDIFDTTATKKGVCIKGFKATGGSWGYQHAIEQCASVEKNGYLANEFTRTKHEYLKWYMERTFPHVTPLEYYIGLRYLNGKWMWEQPAGRNRIPLTTTGYTAWAPGYPQSNSTGQVVVNRVLSPGELEFVWAPAQSTDWLFICQVQSSSTEHYTEWIVE